MTAGAIGLAIALVGTAAGAADECRLIRGAATVDDPTDDVQVCRLDTFFAAGTHRLGNLGGAGQGTLPTWDTTAPTGSFPAAGAAYVTNGPGSVAQPGNRTHEATFSGTYTGPIDNMAVTMFVSSPIYQSVGIGYSMDLQLTIDGQVVVPFGTELDVPLTGVNEYAGQIKFAITNVADAMELNGMEFADPAANHTIQIQFVNWYYGDGNSLVLFDNADYPSNMTFNLGTQPVKSFFKIDARGG
jgi:hypothetical protein